MSQDAVVHSTSYRMTMGLDKEDLMSVSRVNGRLGVIFLSDTTTADGKHLETLPATLVNRRCHRPSSNFQEKLRQAMTGKCERTSGASTL